MLDWLIVGGGIHGALVARVVREAGVPLDRLRVLDPHAEPLARFRQCAAATGLDYPALVDRLVQTALRRGTGLR